MKSLGNLDLLVILAYFAMTIGLGIMVKRRATRDTDSFFLADRNVPWWMLGLSGCSSYIDISGTIAVVTAIFYVGAKSSWVFHVIWGLFGMAFFMAYQAKYVRRSGVMTFAEWNATRFGRGPAVERARLASALFVVVLMVFNFAMVAVGTGKFASEFLPLETWQSTLIVFAVVGVYCTMGGFMGVILTDVMQTCLIGVGAVFLGIIAMRTDVSQVLAVKNPQWLSVTPSWNLWPDFKETTAPSFQHFGSLGFLLMASIPWMLFRLLSGPTVWDFQFFLTLRSAREASLSAGLWTVGNMMRWTIASALVIIGFSSVGAVGSKFDAELLLPMVLKDLHSGLKGLFIAIMLAALMSTISAMANLLSSVVINDFVRRYLAKNSSEKRLVRIGQAVSALALFSGFLMSTAFTSVVAIWEVTIFVVVTMILVPATLRWHWWRFGPTAFVNGMAASALVAVGQKVFFPHWSVIPALLTVVPLAFILTVLFGFLGTPPDREVLVRFYAKVRPFGFWEPIRREAVARGLVPANDNQPRLDMLNALLCSAFQFCAALIPFYLFVRQWPQAIAWSAATLGLCVALYFTWYKTLPPADEETRKTSVVCEPDESAQSDVRELSHSNV